ncbi:hypothetical protein DFJ58DRAFT_730198 [Suillus subalutaceus]|uniref:uncharacterized protein n=1 Tax=Suillus subalutaceus TaxID=48586 RepID=UPI001B8638B5|nr:uncharacterized protein DFJ58DRAFT_730198 [Suillus subalutaceus]KAG1847316.1 hypothetical protein DFJ58DRAFT_730198 [Suillus subalutaceus]
MPSASMIVTVGRVFRHPTQLQCHGGCGKQSCQHGGEIQAGTLGPDPSFPPPAMGPTSGSTATAMGIKYLTGVFGPSVAPNANSVAVGQPSASRPFSRPDVQGSTFSSGQPSSESVQASPSSAPAIQCDFSVSCPASTTSSLP